jgi:hypothetical protein
MRRMLDISVTGKREQRPDVPFTLAHARYIEQIARGARFR